MRRGRGGSVTERAKYLAAPPLERVAAGKPSSQSIQNNTLGFGSGVRTSNRVRPSSEKAETSFCQILSLAMTNRLIFVCSLFATSTARGFSEFPLAFLPNFRYLPTYLPTDDDGFLHCYGNFEKNSTDIEVVFSYLRHMERTQRFQIEGRNISDCNRSLNLMKFYYHTRLYLRTSINFIVPD